MTVGDREDDPPMQPPATVPAHERPEPLMESFRSAETEQPFPPPPGLPGSLMASTETKSTEPAPNETAAAVLEALGPTIKNLYEKLDELLKLREQVSSLDRGIGSVLGRIADLEERVEQAITFSKRSVDGWGETQRQLEDFRKHEFEAVDKLGARVLVLEQHRELERPFSELAASSDEG